MINRDKFGQEIYPNIYKKLLYNAIILQSKGYRESHDKPNLFYKPIREGVFFSDMRGTEDVPIWKDTRPLLYWRFNPDVPNWLRRRVIKEELTDLFNEGCPCRLSFYLYNSEEFIETSADINESDGIYDWADGYCRFCGKDFHADGEFCSDECEKNYMLKIGATCAACGKKIEFLKEVRHHVSYFPEEIVYAHSSCHGVIHKTDLYPDLKPPDGDSAVFYEKKNKPKEILDDTQQTYYAEACNYDPKHPTWNRSVFKVKYCIDPVI